MVTVVNSMIDVTDGVHYPSSDGKPLAETPFHFAIIAMVRALLDQWLAPEADNVCIAANLFVYYEQGNRRRHVTPDIFFVRGAPPSRDVRRRYLTWREPKQTLDFVLEVTSQSTHREDRVTKRQIYQDILQVKEYFLFDPYSEWIRPPIQGLRLQNGVYQEIERVNGRVPSEQLGLHLEQDGRMLRFFNPLTNAWLPTQEEQIEQAEQAIKQADRERKSAEQERQREARARKKAEKEVEKLRAEIERLRQQLPEQS